MQIDIDMRLRYFMQVINKIITSLIYIDDGESFQRAHVLTVSKSLFINSTQKTNTFLVVIKSTDF